MPRVGFGPRFVVLLLTLGVLSWAPFAFSQESTSKSQDPAAAQAEPAKTTADQDKDQSADQAKRQSKRSRKRSGERSRQVRSGSGFQSRSDEAPPLRTAEEEERQSPED